MPLIEAQKPLIANYISDFFSELTPDSLIEIQAAFEQKLNDTHINFILLQKCFADPQAYLHGVEKINPDITIGDVRTYIIEYAQTCLKTASPLSLIHVGLLQQFSDNNFPFFSQSLADNIYYTDIDTASLEHTLLSVTMSIVEFNDPNNEYPLNHVQLHIDISQPISKHLDVIYAEIPEEVQDFDAIRRFILDLTPDLIQTSKEIAAKSILKSTAATLSPGLVLIVQKHFYNLIKQGIIALSDLESLTLEQVMVLEKYEIQREIASKNAFLAASHYTLAEANIIAHFAFNRKFLDKEIKVLGVTSAASTHILFPPITNLILLHILAFDDAKRLKSKYGANILCNEFYYNYFLKNPHKMKRSLEALKNLTAEENDILLLQPIIKLIAYDCASISRVLLFSEKRRKMVCGNRINEMLCNKQISLLQAMDLSDHTANAIEGLALFNEFIPNENHSINFSAWAFIFSSRLSHIYSSQPVIINDIADHPWLWTKDLKQACVREKIEMNHLRNYIFRLFLLDLKDKIPAQYDEFFIEISDTEEIEEEENSPHQSYYRWMVAFYNVTQLAVIELNKIKQNRSSNCSFFFCCSPDDRTQDKRFYKKLVALANLIEPEEIFSLQKTRRSCCF